MSAEKHSASAFVEKWNKPYSEMVFYVHVRMALAVVCANSLLILGIRDCQWACQPVIKDLASMYDWRSIVCPEMATMHQLPNTPHIKAFKWSFDRVEPCPNYTNKETKDKVGDGSN